MTPKSPTTAGSDQTRARFTPETDQVSGWSPKSLQTSARTSLEVPRSAHPGGSGQSSGSSVKPSHQRLVLTDPVAFRYLEEDTVATVLERRRDLAGYECYVVEQWATSRTHPTFVITTYTGDPKDKVVVNILSVPTDESAWSQRLRVYFKALNQYHARRRDTPLGIMMVTNLSGFSSSLTVIPVPDGDLAKHRSDFFVNENLKRLGCSGRVGLTLSPPNDATSAKFYVLYRTNDKIPLASSVVELVKLCQAALHLFSVLEIDYADGLLCDVTETAINDWWVTIGTEIYNVEPHDGILGPTTVAALLGLLMGARNRLHAISAPVPKDPFDVDAMKRGIASFQKTQRLTRTRRLDRKTLRRLHDASEKAAYSEGWSMPRAVKSTVAELSGKGGEMIADAVGRGNKAGIAEIETTDIEHFTQLLFGDRCKWLWQGKALKRTSMPKPDEKDVVPDHLEFKTDDQGHFAWAGRKGTLGGDMATRHEAAMHSATHKQQRSYDDMEAEKQGKNLMVKRATGILNEGRSGLDRIKDAVNLRGHQQKFSRDDTAKPMSAVTYNGPGTPERAPLRRSHTSPEGPASLMARPSIDQRDEESQQQPKSAALDRRPAYTDELLETPHQSESSLVPPFEDQSKERQSLDHEDPSKLSAQDMTDEERSPGNSVAASTVDGGGEMQVDDPDPDIEVDSVGVSLRQTQSFSAFAERKRSPRDSNVFPRHLSFSAAEAGTTYGASDGFFAEDNEQLDKASLEQQLAHEKSVASHLKRLRYAVEKLSREEGAWAKEQLSEFSRLLVQADSDHELLESLYQTPLQSIQDAKDMRERILRDEREAMEEGKKELETLAAKLDYEIGSLRGKVEDVDLGVGDFERAVSTVESRVNELQETVHGQRRWDCVMS